MSATSSEVGIIIHVNDEIQNILGYQRKDLVNQNIKMIMPGPIGKVHDNFIHRYFETARPTVIDI
jgi:PAS domain S-box-containing protein